MFRAGSIFSRHWRPNAGQTLWGLRIFLSSAFNFCFQAKDKQRIQLNNCSKKWLCSYLSSDSGCLRHISLFITTCDVLTVEIRNDKILTAKLLKWLQALLAILSHCSSVPPPEIYDNESFLRDFPDFHHSKGDFRFAAARWRQDRWGCCDSAERGPLPGFLGVAKFISLLRWCVLLMAP